MAIVFVIGIPGSGYEQVAKRVASQLNWQSVDVVAQAANNLGAELQTLYIYHSEAAISAQYQQCFKTVINGIQAGEIVSGMVILPSDLFDNSDNLVLWQKLKNPRGIFFDLNIQILSQRVGLNKPRAVGLGKPRAILRQMINEKQTVWKELGFAHIDANTEDMELLMEELKSFITNNSQSDFD